MAVVQELHVERPRLRATSIVSHACRRGPEHRLLHHRPVAERHPESPPRIERAREETSRCSRTGKGARLHHPDRPGGAFTRLSPQENHIGISEEERARDPARAAHMPESGGYIVRTNAENATDEQLADIAYGAACAA